MSTLKKRFKEKLQIMGAAYGLTIFDLQVSEVSE